MKSDSFPLASVLYKIVPDTDEAVLVGIPVENQYFLSSGIEKILNRQHGEFNTPQDVIACYCCPFSKDVQNFMNDVCENHLNEEFICVYSELPDVSDEPMNFRPENRGNEHNDLEMKLYKKF